MVKIIGTKNNIERTGTRDLEISRLMRLPSSTAEGCSGLRAIDFDVTIVCDQCGLPVFLQECTRNFAPKSHRYVSATAKKLGVPAFLIRHGKELGGKILVQQVSPTKEDPNLYTEEEFTTWCENTYRSHKENTCESNVEEISLEDALATGV